MPVSGCVDGFSSARFAAAIAASGSSDVHASMDLSKDEIRFRQSTTKSSACIFFWLIISTASVAVNSKRCLVILQLTSQMW